MYSLTDEVNIRAFRSNMSSVVNRVGYANERIGLVRHHQYVGVLISPHTLKLLQTLEERAEKEYQRLVIEQNPVGVAERSMFDAIYKLNSGEPHRFD